MLSDTAGSNQVQSLDKALAEAMMISVSEPTPLTIRPPRSRRTVTSPWASVPLVMLLTEYSCRLQPESTRDSIALKVASTGPLPSASTVCSSQSTVRVSFALGTTPVSEQTCMQTSP